MKQRNFVAKYMNSVNKNAKHADKKKLLELGKSKHKNYWIKITIDIFTVTSDNVSINRR